MNNVCMNTLYVARPARTFFKNQKIRASRTERCRHWTTHVSGQATRRDKHPIRKLDPARPGRLLFPSHFLPSASQIGHQ